MKKKWLTLLCVSIIIIYPAIMFSCSHEADDDVIDMDNMQTRELYTSDNFESIEYIPLETMDRSLIGNDPCIYIIDRTIGITDEDNCLIFNRQTGKWLGRVGNKGRGPADYLSIPHGVIVNESDKTIYLSQNGKLIEYSLSVPFSAKRTFQFPLVGANHLVCMGRDMWAIGLLNFVGNNAN
jgi:hypothetical protein